mgnify:CR=1 FL=1
MKKTTKTIFNSLKEADRITTDPIQQLHFNNGKNSKSLVGGILTLLIYVFILIYGVTEAISIYNNEKSYIN